MPICAPVGGSPGVAMNGHSTGAWSDVIRHVDTGADGGRPPRPRPRAPRADAGRNSRGSRRLRRPPARCGGQGWPKSASSRARSRPPTRPVDRGVDHRGRPGRCGSWLVDGG